MDDMQVYLGVWTNWSRGAVMGATLTTTREYGNLLIALTAFFIPFVATRFWRICCFFLHRLHSTAKPKGAIHHQRQVLLRNASSMESALIMLYSLLNSWRARKHAKLGTLLPLLGFTLFIIAAFTVAGGFSSRISSGICDEVLVNGNNCAIAGMDIGDNMDKFEAFTSYVSRAYTDASNYARQCYSDSSSGMLGCDRFIVKSLKAATIETNRTCPFQGDICRNNNTNIRLDTGYIDSHDHLGSNAPPSERLGYRYVLECAPIKTEGRVTHANQGNITYARYDYGNKVAGGTDNRTLLDYTYEVEDLSYQYSPDYRGPVKGDFLLSTERYQVLYGNISSVRASFMPVPELIRLDGDVELIFLSGNGVYFFESMNDDWYRATAKGRLASSALNAGSHQTYQPVEAASPLACVEQWQWCNSSYRDGSGCGPLASTLDAIIGASHLFNISDESWQDAGTSADAVKGAPILFWQVLTKMTGDLSIDWAIKELKTYNLASRASSIGGLQYSLPTNQWQLDVTNWFNTVLAKTQANMVNSAVGYTDPTLRGASWTPTSKDEQHLCDNQKIRSTDHASFSLFGLYFTYITGALIIVISLILEPIFGCLHDRAKYKQYEHLEWITNATLQLHRLAYEEIESQKWSGCTDSVPTTLPEVNLASLNIEDLDHPTLARPTNDEREVVEVNSIKTAKNGLDANSEDTVTNGELSGDELTDYLGLGSMISSIRLSSWDPLQWTYSTSQSPLSDHFADF